LIPRPKHLSTDLSAHKKALRFHRELSDIQTAKFNYQ
jgi:hypothetical protein